MSTFNIVSLTLRGVGRRFTLFSSSTRTCTNRCPCFYLIVHHNHRFQQSQHKVVCKLLLTVVYGRPLLFLPNRLLAGSVRSTSTLSIKCQESSIFCTASLLLQLSLVQDTHVCVYAVRGIGGLKNEAQRNVKPDHLRPVQRYCTKLRNYF